MSTIVNDPWNARHFHRNLHQIEELADLSADKAALVVQVWEEIKASRSRISMHDMPGHPSDVAMLSRGLADMMPAAQAVALALSHMGNTGFSIVAKDNSFKVDIYINPSPGEETSSPTAGKI